MQIDLHPHELARFRATGSVLALRVVEPQPPFGSTGDIVQIGHDTARLEVAVVLGRDITEEMAMDAGVYLDGLHTGYTTDIPAPCVCHGHPLSALAASLRIAGRPAFDATRFFATRLTRTTADEEGGRG